MRGHQMAQNGQIHDFHSIKGKKVKEINANMPQNDKCDVTACIYIKFDRMYRVILKKVLFGIFSISKGEKNCTMKSKDRVLSLSRFS